MQNDFHYAVIKCLAYKAGFTEEQAQIIAYASQYVDDATEWCGLKIEDTVKEFDGCFRNGLFEPTCTATMDIKSFTGDVQRKVFQSFHFLPGDEPTPPLDYVVKPGGAMAKTMMRRVGGPIRELCTRTVVLSDIGKALRTEIAAPSSPASPQDVPVDALIRLGIALHTYADTWSHQGWTGRKESNNDVEDIGEFRNGAFHKYTAWERFRLGFMGFIPDIGHAEVLHLPDQAWQAWGFTRHGKDVRIFNDIRFREAAHSIYRTLLWCRGIDGDHLWNTFADALASIFRNANRGWDHTFESLTNAFGIELKYDKLEWRKAALVSNHVNWGGFSARAFAGLNQYKAGDTKWFWFHYWARDQRAWVLSWL